jgi:hypothetical protein
LSGVGAHWGCDPTILSGLQRSDHSKLEDACAVLGALCNPRVNSCECFSLGNALAWGLIWSQEMQGQGIFAAAQT